MTGKKKETADNANLYASYYANFSGNWNNGDNAGPFQFNVNYATSNSNLGTHQMFDPSFSMFRNDVTAPAKATEPGRGFNNKWCCDYPATWQNIKIFSPVSVDLKINFQG